nr:compass component swd1 [Cryptococcus depauperatus CBS 7855]
MQQLLNPFAQKYPDAVDSTLFTSAACVAFNPTGRFAGHYLAVGNSDGVVKVWDVETRGPIRSFAGHVRPVESLSWSRNNRYLLSASSDSTAIIWDLSTLRFDAPLTSASFHPRNSRIILAVLSCGEVILVDLRKGGGRFTLVDDTEVEDQTEQKTLQLTCSHRISMTCADFSPCGSRIYVGTSNGMLLVFDPMSKRILQRAKLANSTIQALRFDSSGYHLITSASDRALRLLQVDPLTLTLTPLHRFQDLINRTPWNSIGFSGDAEYVMGGAGNKMAHNVFVWDRESGVIVKVLEGPKEPLIACAWHPVKPVIASVATSGDVHIWQHSSSDNWAAFAPGFEELEENVEYDEREDEFDIEDETEANHRKDKEEDIFIDVLTPIEDSFPRRIEPILALPANLTFANDEERLEAEKLVESIVEVTAWADGETAENRANGANNSDITESDAETISKELKDGDSWEGFYLSQDLLSEIRDDDDE